MRTVTPTGQPMLLIDQELFRRDAAHLEAAMRAARAYAIEVFGEAQATVDRGDALDDELYQRMRQITTYATRVAVDVVNFAYEAAGSTALRRSPLQRCFRDLHSATQHIVVDATTYIEAAPVVLSSYR